MAKLRSGLKGTLVFLAIAGVLSTLAIAPVTMRHMGAAAAKSLSNAKQIGLCCKEYAVDHDGKYPPSLDALFPAYLQDRSILASPVKPGDPIGYTYFPGLTEASPPDTVLLDDNFAPRLSHHRIVVYANDSARILETP